MEILKLDQELVKQAAQLQFNKYIQIVEMDLYLKDIEKATCILKGYDQKLFVSTHYAYEDVDVNGNITRYKVALCAVLVKEHAYEVVYDSKGKLFVAYKENDEIKFMLYEQFLDFVMTLVEIVDDVKQV